MYFIDMKTQWSNQEYLFYWVTSLNMLKDYRCLNVELIKILKLSMCGNVRNITLF